MPLDSLRDTPGVSADSELEAVLIHHKQLEAVADSFRTAFESLSARERHVLLLRVEDELAAVEIARRLGVHKAQISRIIHRAENELRMILFTRLGTHHRLGREAIEECAAQILRSAETSLTAFLRANKKQDVNQLETKLF